MLHSSHAVSVRGRRQHAALCACPLPRCSGSGPASIKRIRRQHNTLHPLSLPSCGQLQRTLHNIISSCCCRPCCCWCVHVCICALSGRPIFWSSLLCIRSGGSGGGMVRSAQPACAQFHHFIHVEAPEGLSRSTCSSTKHRRERQICTGATLT